MKKYTKADYTRVAVELGTNRRRCPHCARSKALTSFGLRRIPDGSLAVQSWCRLCRAEANKSTFKPEKSAPEPKLRAKTRLKSAAQLAAEPTPTPTPEPAREPMEEPVPIPTIPLAGAGGLQVQPYLTGAPPPGPYRSTITGWELAAIRQIQGIADSARAQRASMDTQEAEASPASG